MLKKVVVFDSNISGGLIGDMIENELPVEVIRVNDLAHAPYFDKSESEIRELTERAIKPYISRVDLIILAEPEVTLTSENYLKKKYPTQKFVGYGKSLPQVIRKEKIVRILTTPAVRRTTRYQQMKAACFGTKISERECIEWHENISRYGTIDKTVENEIIDLAVAGFKEGLIVIYTTEVMRIAEKIRDRLRWRGTVVDMRNILLRDVCSKLNFKGLDGKLKRDIR